MKSRATLRDHRRQPAAGSRHPRARRADRRSSPGDFVSYEGAASDADDGTLPASALSWTVLLHHNTHMHTFVGSTGVSGSFQTEYHGAGNFAYELVLTATDSSGLSRTVAAAAAARARHHAADGARIADCRVGGRRASASRGPPRPTAMPSPAIASSGARGLSARPSRSSQAHRRRRISTPVSRSPRPIHIGCARVDAAGLLSAYSHVASATTPRDLTDRAITGERSTPTGNGQPRRAQPTGRTGGCSTSSTVTRKAGIAPLIGRVTMVGGNPASFVRRPSGDLRLERRRADDQRRPPTAAIYIEGDGQRVPPDRPCGYGAPTADALRRRLARAGRAGGEPERWGGTRLRRYRADQQRRRRRRPLQHRI